MHTCIKPTNIDNLLIGIIFAGWWTWMTHIDLPPESFNAHTAHANIGLYSFTLFPSATCTILSSIWVPSSNPNFFPPSFWNKQQDTDETRFCRKMRKTACVKMYWKMSLFLVKWLSAQNIGKWFAKFHGAVKTTTRSMSTFFHLFKKSQLHDPTTNIVNERLWIDNVTFVSNLTGPGNKWFKVEFLIFIVIN